MNFVLDRNVTLFFGRYFNPAILRSGPVVGDGFDAANSPKKCESLNLASCSDGLILPTWNPPVTSSDQFTVAYRATVYLLAIGYMLFGVNVITDRILSAIEVIVSQKRTVVVKSKSGEQHKIDVPVWHHVVATLTVYVIGTSTPEIFLPIVEVIKRRFEADELGPAVVVGSGAYHLFLITGVCLASVREPAGKPIRDLNVFFVTAIFAIFAYLWIYLLVALISPGVIELWEALATLCLFPAIVFTAWFVERRLPHHIYTKLKKIGKPTATPAIQQPQPDTFEAESGAMLDGMHERRRRLAQILQQFKKAYPEKSRGELEEMAEMKLLEEIPKDAAFYRMQAGKTISGGGNVISKEKIKERLREEFQRKSSIQVIAIDPNMQYVSFDVPRYTCIESCGQTTLTVTRSGPGIGDTVLSVDYETYEGTAKVGEDFEAAKGKLTFGPGQSSAEIVVTIIDDDVFEDDKEFFVRIWRPQLKHSKISVTSLVVPTVPASVSHGDITFTQRADIALGVAAVCIMDDDHCGVFSFDSPESAIADNVGTAKIKVIRSTGARGCVAVPYKVTPGSAKPNDDYIVPVPAAESSHQLPVVIFENDQFDANIEIAIVDKNRIGEVSTFYIELQQPEIQSSPPVNPLGNPVLGKPSLIKLGICEDAELKEALDRLLKMADISHLVGTTTWRGQFKEAFKINFDGDISESSSSSDDGTTSPTESGSTKPPCSCWSRTTTYIIYALSLPWRLLAATLPPTYLLHGWVAFLSLLGVLAFMAAITGDLATHFGCTVGLDDSVTAITLIAFGMGLPDTFASRHAAISEKTADAAIGHITGSNAVSVFLGIGISWTMAASYHLYYDRQFLVPLGSLGLSVTLYCAFATAGLLTLLLRRLPPIGGELGGPTVPRIISAIFFICLWFAFVILSVLENYCIIPGF